MIDFTARRDGVSGPDGPCALPSSGGGELPWAASGYGRRWTPQESVPSQPSGRGEGDSGEMLLLWGSLWAQLWVGRREEEGHRGESSWRGVSMVSTSPGHCPAQILTWFWPGRAGVSC